MVLFKVQDRKMIFIQHGFMPPLKIVLHLGKSTRIFTTGIVPNYGVRDKFVMKKLGVSNEKFTREAIQKYPRPTGIKY